MTTNNYENMFEFVTTHKHYNYANGYTKFLQKQTVTIGGSNVRYKIIDRTLYLVAIDLKKAFGFRNSTGNQITYMARKLGLEVRAIGGGLSLQVINLENAKKVADAYFQMVRGKGTIPKYSIADNNRIKKGAVAWYRWLEEMNLDDWVALAIQNEQETKNKTALNSEISQKEICSGEEQINNNDTMFYTNLETTNIAGNKIRYKNINEIPHLLTTDLYMVFGFSNTNTAGWERLCTRVNGTIVRSVTGNKLSKFVSFNDIKKMAKLHFDNAKSKTSTLSYGRSKIANEEYIKSGVAWYKWLETTDIERAFKPTMLDVNEPQVNKPTAEVGLESKLIEAPVVIETNHQDQTDIYFKNLSFKLDENNYLMERQIEQQEQLIKLLQDIKTIWL